MSVRRPLIAGPTPTQFWLQECSSAFRLLIATSWLAPDSWRAHQEYAIRQAVAGGPDWQEYLALVDRHRTPALSWAALTRTPGINVPAAVRGELQRRDRACRLAALHRTTALAEVIRNFNRAEIPVIPLKGPLLSLELYGDTGIRQSWDLDVLVTEEDYPRATKRLEDMGWRTIESDRFLSFLTPQQSAAVWRHAHHVGYVHPRNGFLELHWSILSHQPEQTAGCWARSVHSTWSGATFRRMDSIDQTLYLCEHGSEHAWFRAKWLGDLARLYAIKYVDWNAADDRTRAAIQERPLLLALRLLNEVYGLPLPFDDSEPIANLPPLLIRHTTRRLQRFKETAMVPSFSFLWEKLCEIRFDRALRPHKTWRQSLREATYRADDFALVRLPDKFFWAYAPLRPFLWIVRVLRRFSPHLGNSKQPSA